MSTKRSGRRESQAGAAEQAADNDRKTVTRGLNHEVPRAMLELAVAAASPGVSTTAGKIAGQADGSYERSPALRTPLNTSSTRLCRTARMLTSPLGNSSVGSRWASGCHALDRHGYFTAAPQQKPGNLQYPWPLAASSKWVRSISRSNFSAIEKIHASKAAIASWSVA